jgi:hypothetical protein
MTGFFKRRDRLERELHAARPQPADELIRRIEGRVRSQVMPVQRGSFRIAVPVGLTAMTIGALAAVGGVGYAASSVKSAADAVAHVVAPAKSHRAIVVVGLSAGSDQYQPGYGFGDDNHNHSGPPGMEKQGGAFAPPLQTKKVGKSSIVSTSFTIDEQAHLFVSVIETKSKKELLVTQKKSKIGSGLSGQQAKNLNYLVLVPRTIPIKLAIPSNLLKPSKLYAIRIIARDPDGNKTTLLIPFRA